MTQRQKITQALRGIACAALMLGAAAGLTSCEKADIYVSTDGSDEAQGTIDAPFATLARALQQVRAGETIYLRGGTYAPTGNEVMGTTMRDMCDIIYKLDKSGTAQHPITICPYPGEKVTFNMRNVAPQGKRVIGFFVTGDYWHLRDFDIVGIQVTQASDTQSENITIDGGSCVVVERVAVHDGMGVGFTIKDGHDNLLLNCDAYNNYDPVSDNGKGGDNDGFGLHLRHASSTGNVVRGCRAWRNADDGFDAIYSYAPVLIDSCWAWQNGYDADMNARAAGNGFKAGGYGNHSLDELRGRPVPRNTVSHSIAWANKGNGFYANHHPGGIDWIDNRAMANRTNFNFANQKAPGETDEVGGYDHLVKDNVAYKATRNEYSKIDPTACTIDHNTFLPYHAVLSDSDFVSLDATLLRLPRKACGSLPDIEFLKLKEK